ETHMSKRATPLKKPEIMLDQNAPAPLYRQLYERLRGSILAGQLEAGTRLPSTRVLASSLGVSRTTTALAYELLLLEGYIESRVPLIWSHTCCLIQEIRPGSKIPGIREREGHCWPPEQKSWRCQLMRRVSMSMPGDSSVQRRDWPSSLPRISSQPESP